MLSELTRSSHIQAECEMSINQCKRRIFCSVEIAADLRGPANADGVHFSHHKKEASLLGIVHTRLAIALKSSWPARSVWNLDSQSDRCPMFANLSQHRGAQEFNDDSDSSDGTNPPTPKKNLDRGGPSASGPKQKANGQSSPLTSPTKPTGPSPKRNLFSRPSKMHINTSTKDMAARDPRDVVGPTSPQHYFSTQTTDSTSTTQAVSSTSTFSSFLKHAGNHVPHAHAASVSRNQASTSSGSVYSTSVKGRSFDLLRVGNPAGDGLGHGPISPSFFSTAGRSVSGANVEHDDNWPLICARVLPLFNGEGLRQPIEDLNRLVSTHLRRVSERHEQAHVMEDVTELFETGIRSLDNNLAALPDEKLISRLSEIWVFFFSTVLPYLEATFLPLTIELANDPGPYQAQTTGNANPPPSTAQQNTKPSSSSSATSKHESPTSTSTSTSFSSHPAGADPSTTAAPLTVHVLATRSYRDILILPLHARLSDIFSRLPLLMGHGNEVSSRLLQCVSILRRVQSGDARQRDCDALGNAVLFRRAKGRGDRRGIIGSRRTGERSATQHDPGTDEDDDDGRDDNVHSLTNRVDDEGRDDPVRRQSYPSNPGNGTRGQTPGGGGGGGGGGGVGSPGEENYRVAASLESSQGSSYQTPAPPFTTGIHTDNRRAGKIVGGGMGGTDGATTTTTTSGAVPF